MKNGHLVNTGKTNPKRTQSKPISEKAKMNVTSYITAGYENKSPNRAPKKRTQISKRQKPIQTPLLQRIMKKACFWVPKKRTQNEPNLRRFKPNLRKKHENLCHKLSTTFHNCPTQIYAKVGLFDKKITTFHNFSTKKNAKRTQS